MARGSQIIWIGIAHIKSKGPKAMVGGVNGAEAYIAIRADKEDEFVSKVTAVFGQNSFQVLGLRSIENEFDVPKDLENPQAAEKIELFKRLASGRVFAWGNFYPHGEYDFEHNS